MTDDRTPTAASAQPPVTAGKPARASRPICLRCGFEVPKRMWGCKNPCPNCGTIYPLGDCSD